MKLRHLYIWSLVFLFALLQEKGWAQDRLNSTNNISTHADHYWGVRTNMLYNSASFVNLGIDYSLGTHWALSAEAICPWWNYDDNHQTTQMLNLGLETRWYWRGWNERDYAMSGPFVGAHVNGGVYDLARQNKGIQSKDYFVMGGAVIGYSAYLERSWRLNFALGLGYLYAPYIHYDVIDEGAVLFKHKSGVFQSVIPTKIEMSVVWLLNNKKVK